MGYSISLTEKQYVDVEVADIGNYTYNVSKMYREAMNGNSLSDFDGMKAGEAIELLRIGYADMVKNPEKYKLMNPENGWGNYEGAKKYLGRLLTACCDNPDATIDVS